MTDQPKTHLNVISGGYWPIESIDITPSVCLADWQCFELQLPGNAARTRHLAGTNALHFHGQVSSAICEMDPNSRKCKTASGRVYELSNGNGLGADGQYTWNHWCRVNGAEAVIDVTAEVEKLLAKRA